MSETIIQRLTQGPLLNTKEYSTFELISFGVGCYMWAVVYFIVIKDIIKKKSVDIPVLAIAGNIAWELLWGFFFRTNMGLVLQWAYAIWFLLDCFIVYSAFKYGFKQEPIINARRYSKFTFATAIFSWLVVFIFFIPVYDDNIGAFTGWILNTLMSFGFILQKIQQPSFGTNRWVAVCKFLGTGFCVPVCFIQPELHKNHVLLALCILFAIFDLIYIYMVFTGPKNNATQDDGFA